MRNLIIISLIFFSNQVLLSQNNEIIFSSRVSYSPSFNCRYEYYIQNGQTVKHNYENKSKNCWDLKFNKGRKTKSISLISISDFIKDINKCDTLKISISKGIKDSLPITLLDNSNYFKNDSLTIIFGEFKTEYYKPDSTIFGLLPKFEGVQIDGNWLTTDFIQNQDTLLSINKSYSGSPRVSGFKEWLTLYLIYHEYNLFQELSINQYLSEENFTYLIRTYLETMKN